MKNKLALIVAVVLGIVAVYGFQRVLRTQKETVQQQSVPVPVAAAGQYIAAGQVITPQMVVTKQISPDAVSGDSILSDRSVSIVGRTINRNVESGDPLLWSYFREPAEKLEQRLASNERAVTLRVDAITGVAGNLAPGSRVDIFGTFPISIQESGGARPAAPATGAASAATHTVLLLDNVKILAVDNRTRDEEYIISGGARGRSYSTITVAATQLEAHMLVYAQQAGTLTMSLRSPFAETDAAVQDVSDKNLLDLAAAARKARAEQRKSRPLGEFVP